jgi:hypothetical protein
MLIVCISAGRVNDPVAVVRWRAELERPTARVDDVMVRTGRDEYCKSRTDRHPNDVEHRLTGTRLDAQELVEFVNLRADLFARLQGHDDELAVPRRVENPAETVVLDG